MKKWVWYSCLLFIISDTIFSFNQFIHTPLDGDVPSHVIPTAPIKTVLEHPLGLYAIISNTHYHNPNRFFSHWTMYEYMNKSTMFLQSFFKPILSGYIASGLFKVFIQLSLLILFSYIATNSSPWSNKGIVAMTLLTPFFQTQGLNEVMALIDPAITYVFFFAFPICLLIIFFLPFIFKFYWQKNCPKSYLWLITWCVLGVVVALSGSINFGVCLTLVASMFLYFLINYKKIVFIELPWRLSVLILVISSMALYSLYLNYFNTMNEEIVPNLVERYYRMPKGIYHLLTRKIGYSVLIFITLIQYFLLKYCEDSHSIWRLKEFMKFILIFSILYLILLPLGGYRNYRYYLIRYDIIMPITIFLILFYGMSGIVLLKHIQSRFKNQYKIWLIIIMLFYIIVDIPDFEDYECQKNSIETLINAPQDTVCLSKNCNIMTWDPCIEPSQSQDPVTLLKKWNILNNNKLFYQK